VSNDSERLVEAALFMAGKPVTVSEIQETQNIDSRTIRSALNKLQDKYESKDMAIEVVKIGTKYVMQVKEQYRPNVESIVTPELSKEVLKVASLIGYYQPILQSRLSALAGPQIYDGVRELVEIGFIRAKPKGRSLELTTTSKFIEYFGISARSRSEVKAWFEKKLHQVPGKD